MKTIVKFTIWNYEEGRTTSPIVEEKIFAQLCKIYPAGNHQRWFEVALPENAPKLQEILALLAANGYRPGPSSGTFKVAPNEYRTSIERIYEKRDYEATAFLVPSPKVIFGEYSFRTDDDLLRIERFQARPKGEIAIGTAYPWIIVSEKLRQMFERAELQRLLFKNVVIQNRTETKKGYFKDHWELTSDLILPPMSAKLLDGDGRPFAGDLQKGCFIDDGLYYPQEPRYKASLLPAVEPFDLGLTYERFGCGLPKTAIPPPPDIVAGERMLIASKKFYEFCVEQKLKMDWVPVRIDP